LKIVETVQEGERGESKGKVVDGDEMGLTRRNERAGWEKVRYKGN
jgi:hypothetical protein